MQRPSSQRQRSCSLSWLHEPVPEPEPEPEPDAGSCGSCPSPTRTDQPAVLARLPDTPRAYPNFHHPSQEIGLTD